MDTATLTAATASLDQWSGAVAWTDRLWPENNDLINNSRIEQVVLRALDETDRNCEDAHLVLPSTDAVVPLVPDTDLVGPLRAHAPTYAACDYQTRGCLGTGPIAGLVPYVAPPQVVALALCPRCLGVLDVAYPHARFVLADPTPDSPEGSLR